MSSNDSKHDFSKEISSFRNTKSHIGANQESTGDVGTFVLVIWINITSSKVLYAKAYCHDAKTTCQATEMVFFDTCTAINV
jgi:hypothetical protein